jgi:hypothetical protein
MATPVLTAALAGVPSGIQSQGVWQGRRQLFVRFAGEAETATMYRADALAREIDRILGRSLYHSISISGRDALGNPDFLASVLGQVTTKTPVMADTDGERPEAITAQVVAHARAGNARAVRELAASRSSAGDATHGLSGGMRPCARAHGAGRHE